MTSNGHSPSFLYVEDNPQSQQVIEMMIRDVMGFTELTVFGDSENFTQRIDALETTPSVIFLDIQISPYDGYDMLGMLRNHTRFQDATIIAMTANVMANDVEQLKASGFDGLIGKPLMWDVFPELVNRILADETVWYIP